jgi:hypothetical protein
VAVTVPAGRGGCSALSAATLRHSVNAARTAFSSAAMSVTLDVALRSAPPARHAGLPDSPPPRERRLPERPPECRPSPCATAARE